MLLQKFKYHGIKGVGTLHVRQMTDAIHTDILRARNARGHFFHHRGCCVLVVVTGYAQDRNANMGQVIHAAERYDG